MASCRKTRLQVIIFIISLCVRSSSSGRVETAAAADFRKWVSWNVENYGKKTTTATTRCLRTDSTPTINGGGGKGKGKAELDIKLREAEMNKVTVTVSPDGSADYTTISHALNAIPLPNSRRLVLVIYPGVYREKVTIPRGLPFVTFLGDAADPPTITGNDTASVIGKNGVPLKTFQSATVGVDANYFVAINIKFENTAAHVIGSNGGQAVALRISGTKAAFYNCSFYGSQDTLYDHKGLHYFHNCFIQGSVDFIFGYGRSLYEKCNINSVARKSASVTAQKRSKSSMGSGFSFKDCWVTGSGRVYLGRAWGDYSRVVFAYTFMDQLVLPQGWSDWGKTSRDKRVYYGEYKCSGPGANFTARVVWAHMLTDEEAQPFLGTHFVDGDSWLI